MAKQAQELTILEYFRTAELSRAELLLVLVRDVIKSRVLPAVDVAVKPKKKRHRRTKAEMEAARAAEAAAKAKARSGAKRSAATDFQPDGEDVELRNAKVVATRIAEELGE